MPRAADAFAGGHESAFDKQADGRSLQYRKLDSFGVSAEVKNALERDFRLSTAGDVCIGQSQEIGMIGRIFTREYCEEQKRRWSGFNVLERRGKSSRVAAAISPSQARTFRTFKCRRSSTPQYPHFL
jgi:hypothetical protein